MTSPGSTGTTADNLAMSAGTARFVPAMLHGALTMLVTGIALVGLNQAQGSPVDNIKIGIKLAVLVVILGLVYVKRDEESVAKPLFDWFGWVWPSLKSPHSGLPAIACHPAGSASAWESVLNDTSL